MVAFLSTSFFTAMISIFTFRFADPWTEDYYYYFADWPTWNNSSNCPYNKKLSYLRLSSILDVWQRPKCVPWPFFFEETEKLCSRTLATSSYFIIVHHLYITAVRWYCEDWPLRKHHFFWIGRFTRILLFQL